MTVLVVIIHIKLPGVEVGCIVLHIPLTVNLLNAIILQRHLKKRNQFLPCGYKLSIHTVHQTDAFHLVEGNGVELLNQLVHIFVAFEFSDAKIRQWFAEQKNIQRTARFLQQTYKITFF